MDESLNRCMNVWIIIKTQKNIKKIMYLLKNEKKNVYYWFIFPAFQKDIEKIK